MINKASQDFLVAFNLKNVNKIFKQLRSRLDVK